MKRNRRKIIYAVALIAMAGYLCVQFFRLPPSDTAEQNGQVEEGGETESSGQAPDPILYESEEKEKGSYRKIYEEGKVLGNEEQIRRSAEELREKYTSGTVRIFLPLETEEMDTKELAEALRIRHCGVDTVDGKEYGEQAVLFLARDGERGADIIFQGTSENGSESYRVSESGRVPKCLQPFVSKEAEAVMQTMDLEEDEYLFRVQKQSIGELEYDYYCFRDSERSLDRDDLYFDNTVLVQVRGNAENGRAVNQVLKMPEEGVWNDAFGMYVDIPWAQERDLNHDGEPDLLFSMGRNAGSGGSRTVYRGYCWDQEKEVYVCFESLPYVSVWLEGDVLINQGRGGAGFEHVDRYELIGGEYRETERIEMEAKFADAMDERESWICSYYRMGELVSQKNLAEDFDLVRELYPHMDYWTRG